LGRAGWILREPGYDEELANEKAPDLRPDFFVNLRGKAYLSQPASIASISNATMLVILIIGFTAGPAVSL
jgi:hypothetical protein